MFEMSLRRKLLELGLAALVAAAIVPIWLPDWLPLQDLPQHLAAIRVLGDYGDPALNLSNYFRITPFQTQYLGYYSAVWLLSWIVEIQVANRLFLTACLATTPYALRYLLAELDRPQFLALFAVPLLYNPFVLLGFINFAAAIPLMLLGLGQCARLRDEYTRQTAISLGVVGIVCFFMHVVPFAFLAIGAATLGLRDSAPQTFWRWLPMLPAGLISILWTFFSPAGSSATKAVGEDAQFRPWREAFSQLPDWTTNITHEAFDDHLLILVGLVAIFVVIAGAGLQRDTPSDTWWPPVQRVTMMAPLAMVAYFALPLSYDWIWPISPRFAIIGMLLAVPALPEPTRWPKVLAAAALVAVSCVQFYQVADSFQSFSRDEVGQLQAAIDEIPKGQRVAGLMFRTGSRHVRFSPFIHSVAYYQAQKGGAVMFTFADFPQSPFRFRESNRPPRVPPRWEWKPGDVNPREDLDWYNYVLVRGGPGRIQRQNDTFKRVFKSPQWSVFRRAERP